MGCLIVQPFAGQAQPHTDDRQLQSDWFFGVDAEEPRIEIGKVAKICIDGLPQCLARTGDAFRYRKILQEAIDVGEQVQHRVIALKADDIRCHVRSDERVAVTVAADPRPETHRTRVRWQLHTQIGEGRGEVLEHLTQRTAGEVV